MTKALLLLLAVLVSGPGFAQDYPNRPVRMVVGFPPGGGTDVVARIITPRLSEFLGQQVVIDNRPGATGTVAAAQVAKATPDGYTIMMGHVSVNAIAPSLFPNLGYDVIRDFSPVALTAVVPHLVVVHPSLKARSLKELIQYLKDHPGLTFPSAGNGSMPHLAGEIFKSLAGVDLVHVPYKGSGQSMQDLLGGQHLVAFDTMAAVGPHVRAGRLVALATSSSARQAAFPEVPSAPEAGLPDYIVNTWYGVFAPAGTPSPIVMRLNAEIMKAIRSPETAARLAEAGADSGATLSSPERFAALVRLDTIRYAQIVKDIGLKID